MIFHILIFSCFRPSDVYVGYLPLAHVLELSAGENSLASFFQSYVLCMSLHFNFIEVLQHKS